MQDRVDPILQPRAWRTTCARRATWRRSAWVSSSGSQDEGRKPAANSWASTSASTLSVLTFAWAIALVFAGSIRPRARHARLEQLRDRVRVAGRLDRHLVGRRQAVGEQPERLRSRADLPDLTDGPVLPDRDLGELAVDVEPDAPSHALSLLRGGRRGRAGGQTTPTDSRSRRTRASRRGGQVLTRARSPSNDERPARPAFAPGCPRPGRSHRTHRPGRLGRRGGHRSRAASAPFHTGYQPARAPQPRDRPPNRRGRHLPQRPSARAPRYLRGHRAERRVAGGPTLLQRPVDGVAPQGATPSPRGGGESSSRRLEAPTHLPTISYTSAGT